MPVITIAHQWGSNGAAIGQEVAGKLGMTLVDHQIVQNVARQLGISEATARMMDEKAEGRILRFLEKLGNGSVPPLGASAMRGTVPTERHVTEKEFFEATRDVILAAAANNNVVIIGHGANFVLSGFKDVFSILTYATTEVRVATLTERNKISPKEALQQLTQNEQERTAYARAFFQTDWTSPVHYDLMVNTGSIESELAVQLITDTVRRKYRLASATS